MTSESGDAAAREERLGEIAFAYLHSLENGQAPDAQDWLKRYPEFAADLTQFLADEETLENLAAPLRQSTAGWMVKGDGWREAENALRPPPSAFYPLFDDYELLAEIGRGGMGIVYKARQKSLNR